MTPHALSSRTTRPARRYAAGSRWESVERVTSEVALCERVARLVVQLIEASSTHPLAASVIRVRAHRYAFRAGAMCDACARLGRASPVLAGPTRVRDSTDMQADIRDRLGFHEPKIHCMAIQCIAPVRFPPEIGEILPIDYARCAQTLFQYRGVVSGPRHHRSHRRDSNKV